MAVTSALALAEKPQAQQIDPRIIESVLIQGDLSKLSPDQRVAYYSRVCDSLGLNVLTQPFKYLTLSGKLVLYATKDCTEQLRKLHGVSITDVSSQRIDDVFVVTAKAKDRTERTDAATGAVSIAGLKGEALANALMKSETKAKRRATLSICGLGMLDETEIDSIHGAQQGEPLVVEAAARVAVPAGAVQIVSARIGAWGGADVVVVDADGVETTHKTTDRQLGELCEQLAQECVPVVLEFQTITRGKNAGKDKLTGARRWTPPVADDATVAEAVVIMASDIPF